MAWLGHQLKDGLVQCTENMPLNKNNIWNQKKTKFFMHHYFCNYSTFDLGIFIFIVAPCILKIHLLSHTNKCTNYVICYLKSA
jgi:hypothetical protein